jgi:glyoxylase-like metal-dependent hydrolase (beta-lactamase superfamily II)
MSGAAWNLVAPGVYQARYDPLDISIIAILCESGVVLVDTRSSPAEADEIIADVRDTFALPVVAVVNTHAHYDHTFGNQRFGSLPIYGHARIPRHFEQHEGPRLAAQQSNPTREPDKDWADVILTPPNHPVDEPTAVDVGGRAIELLPLDPGHTDTDLVVFIPDQRVWILGDVIEESGPPMYGSGSFPLQWATVIGRLLERIEPGDLVIPGHGAVVDRAFVERQMRDLAYVADNIRSSWATHLSIEDALLAYPEYLWPSHMLAPAFARGYSELSSTEAVDRIE